MPLFNIINFISPPTLIFSYALHLRLRLFLKIALCHIRKIGFLLHIRNLIESISQIFERQIRLKNCEIIGCGVTKIVAIEFYKRSFKADGDATSEYAI